MEKIKIIENILAAKIKDFTENAEYWSAKGNFENERLSRTIVIVLKDIHEMLEMDEQQLKYIEDRYK